MEIDVPQWPKSTFAIPGPHDGGQARPHHGRRQQPLDRLGHRPHPGRPGRRACVHLPGRCVRPPRPAARAVARRKDHRAMQRARPRRASTTCSTRIKTEWGGLDFVVHALAYSDPKELSGRYVDTTRENFTNSLVISCFSFTEVAKRACGLMPNGGSMITLVVTAARRVGCRATTSWALPRRRWKRRCAIWPPISARKAFASTRSRPVRCARCRGRASRMRAYLQLSGSTRAAAPHADTR